MGISNDDDDDDDRQNRTNLTMTSSYTCPSPEGTTPTTQSITYKYEVVTRPGTKLDDTTVGSIQKAMLKSVARSSGVRKCSALEVVVEQSQGDNDQGRRTVRRLRQRTLTQRGSNSIVGISSESPNVILADAMCQMKDTAAGVRMIDHYDNDPTTLNNRPREVVPGMDGFVIMEGRNLPPGKAADNVVFVSTPRIGVGGGSRADGAFNYVSTESLPDSHNSQSDHNPLHASTVFVNLENGDRRTLLQDNTEKQQTCLVVQGNMLITIASTNKLYSKYENLEGRIIDALARDVNAMKLGLSSNDIIVRLRMSSPYGFGSGPTSTSSSSSVLAAEMESSNNATLNPLTSTFWQQEYASIPYAMSVLVCMTVLSLALLALFVKSSRRGQSSVGSKSKSKIDNGKTITNWGVELDANCVLKDLHKTKINTKEADSGDEENIPLHSQAQEVIEDKLDKSKVVAATGMGVATTKKTGRRIGRSSSRECTSVKDKVDKSKVAAATTAVAVATGVGVIAERIGRSLSPKRKTCTEKEVELGANRVLKDLHKPNKKTEDDENKTNTTHDAEYSKVVVATTAAAAAAAVTTGVIGRLVSMTKKDTPLKSKRAVSPDDSNSEGASISITIDSPKRTSMSGVGRRERSLVQDRSVHILDDIRWAEDNDLIVKLPYDEELPKPTGEKGLVVAAAIATTAAVAASAWNKTKTKVQAVAESTNTQETLKPFRDAIPRVVSPARDAISRAVSPLSGATSAGGENVEYQLRDYDSIVACDIVPLCVGPFLQRYAATEDEIETSWMPQNRGIWGTDTNKPPAAVRLTSTNGNEKRADRVRRNISNAVAAIDSRSKSPSRSRSSKMDPPMTSIKMDPPSGGLIGKIRTRTTGKSSMDNRNLLPKVASKEQLELSTEEENSVVEFVEVDGFWGANGITNYFR